MHRSPHRSALLSLGIASSLLCGAAYAQAPAQPQSSQPQSPQAPSPQAPSPQSLPQAEQASPAPAPAAPLPPQIRITDLQRGPVAIAGEVSGVFGDRFVLDDGSGQVLVEAGRGRREVDLQRGQRVTVVGEARRHHFEATSLRLPDGRTVELRERGEGGEEGRAGRMQGGDEMRYGTRGDRMSQGHGMSDGMGMEGDGWRGRGAGDGPGFGGREMDGRGAMGGGWERGGEGRRGQPGARGEWRARGEGELTRAEERGVREHLRQMGYAGIRDIEAGPRVVELKARTPHGRVVAIEMDRETWDFLKLEAD
jgi:hypothetical protein